jgi:hypothetical protein
MTLYVGYVASALVLFTFLTRTMKPLRCIALGSNVAFIIYSAMLQLYPILILHCILLPVNVWRLSESMRSRNSVAKATDTSNSHVSNETPGSQLRLPIHLPTMCPPREDRVRRKDHLCRAIFSHNSFVFIGKNFVK